jgi:hypothetical protein
MKAKYRLIGDLCANKVVVRIKSSRKKHSRVKYIILTAVLPVHTVTGSINFPDDVAGITARATEISTKSAASTYVTLAAGVTTAFNLTITNYSAAAPDLRPGMFKLMNDAAKAILATFQAFANSFPLTSIAALHSGGFNAIPAHGAHVKGFGGTNGTLQGTIDMVTAGGPSDHAHLHIWWVSLDAITWNIMRSTNKATVTLTGFAHAKDVYLKTQLSINDVLQAESNIIMVLVN